MGVVLLGYRGSGKTSVGMTLAKRRGMPFIDLDTAIVSTAGMTIREIFAMRGEAAFRDLESAELVRAISLDAVISSGGGVILRDQNRIELNASNHVRIYLRCEPPELHRRIHHDPATAANRPALTHLGGGIEEIQSLLAQREPLYRAVATAELDVTRLNVDEVVDQIERLLL